MQNIRRILVPIDFSACSRAAIDYAAFLARSFEASIDLLHVREPPPLFSPEMVMLMPGDRPGTLTEFAASPGGTECKSLLAELELLRIPVRGRLESGPIAETVVEVADDYDLIVMGTHGRTGLTRLVLGSVAEQVVRHARCPVLTVRAPSPAARRVVESEVRS